MIPSVACLLLMSGPAKGRTVAPANAAHAAMD
jgi:hypothetical protein